jgi:hypothetical protein
VAVVDRGRVEVPAAVLERDLRTSELDQPRGVAVGGGRVVRERDEGAAHREAARAGEREVELPRIDVLAALAASRNGGGEQTEEGVPDGVSRTPQGQRPLLPPLDSSSRGVSRYSDILSTQEDALKRIR